MATPTGIAAVARQAASGYAQRVLPRQRTYTTYWDINDRKASVAKPQTKPHASPGFPGDPWLPLGGTGAPAP